VSAPIFIVLNIRIVSSINLIEPPDMSHPPIEKLVENKRFVEALYFGAIDLASSPTSELHLYLGIACCATIKPIAEIERYLSLETTDQDNQFAVNIHGLCVTRDTLFVNEGLHHFLQAKQLNPQVMFPESIRPITTLVIQDLQDYLRQEFHGFFASQLDYTLLKAALAAVVLICDLQGDDPEKITKLSTARIETSRELIAKLSSIPRNTAAFYGIIST
jgi:hypothetical protein